MIMSMCDEKGDQNNYIDGDFPWNNSNGIIILLLLFSLDLLFYWPLYNSGRYVVCGCCLMSNLSIQNHTEETNIYL